MDSSEQRPHNQTIEQERAELDAKIHELEVLLTALKRRRNTLSSVSKVPADILLQIFDLVIGYDGQVQILDLNSRGIQEENKSQMVWIRSITHVCSTWRYLALGSPSFWSRIRVNSKHEAVLEMLRRSQSQPLTVSLMYLGNSDGVLEEFNSILQDQDYMPRIKHLELGLDYRYAHSVIEKLEWSPPANLESCALSTTAAGTIHIYTPASLPAVLLDDSSDTLRYLRVYRCTFNFSDMIPNISFSKLSEFTFIGHHWEGIALLTHLSFPPTCSVSLTSWGPMHETHSQELEPSVQRIWGQMYAGVDWNFRALVMSHSAMCFAIDETKESDTAATFTIRYHNLSSLDARSFRYWFDAFALDRLTTLRISVPVNAIVWKILGQRCPNIITLALSLTNSSECLVFVLGLVMFFHDRSNHSPDILRELKAFFKLERFELSEPSGLPLDESTRRALLDVLKQRYELGIPIKHLSLHRISRSYLRDLEPYVDGEISYLSLDGESEDMI